MSLKKVSTNLFFFTNYLIQLSEIKRKSKLDVVCIILLFNYLKLLSLQYVTHIPVK